MFRGPLGFRRLTGIGPFTFSQEISEYDELRAAVAESIEEREIDPANPTEDDVMHVIEDLSGEIYPTNEDKEIIFLVCMARTWVHDWTEGFTDVTTGELGAFERVVFGAKGCIGWAEFGRPPASDPAPFSEFIPDDEENS